MNRFPFLSLRYALPLSLLVVAQAVAFYSTSTPEMQFEVQQLSTFPQRVSDWRMVAEYPTEEEVQAVLRADDTLNRSYATDDNLSGANLFIAFFRTQKSGAAPHSPKNCLPGSGWTPTDSGTVTLEVPGWPEPVTINRYIVSRGDSRTLVYYWYQTAHRVLASEYSAKIWLVLDSLRYRRSDTSLVRVVVPLNPNNPEAGEEKAANFVRTFFPTIRQALPQ
jgi:EpsI family protein